MAFLFRSEVVCLTNDGVKKVRNSDFSVEQFGVKSRGLLGVPQGWVPDFFCVSSDAILSSDLVKQAAALAGIEADEQVYVRSSGSMEGIECRGLLVSRVAVLRDVPNIIAELSKQISELEDAKTQKINFLVQRRVKSRAKGHLSNERRVSRVARDWLAEIEPSPGHEAESGAVAVRNWRQQGKQGARLRCDLRAQIFRVLREVAWWAGRRRLHLEWVWDGDQIWIVQCEDAINQNGVRPRSLVKNPTPNDDSKLQSLIHFRVATENDYATYKKLRKAALYKKLGYKLPPFYVMDDVVLLEAIKRDGKVPETVKADLAILTKAPLILRTDGKRIPEKKREMLPRSNELRTDEAGQAWLVRALKEDLSEVDATSCQIAFIGHHFLPAVASAWALAEPAKRRVRIESLWGIPEGIYYFSHDVFDVDVANIGATKEDISGIRELTRRIRYKDEFIAPDETGTWVVHKVAPPADWSSSIGSEDAIKQIANTTRLIAESEDRPVVVMWFVGLSGSSHAHEVLPWWHGHWDVTLPQEGTLGKSERVGITFTVSSEADLERIEMDDDVRSSYKRIAVKPESSEIVRDRQFIDRLAAIAKKRGYVVELRGGVLSHVYYTLRREKCDVVCIDAFATKDERIEFNKIVRDKIPAVIASRGETAQVGKVVGDVLLDGLRRKLVEEAIEVVDAADADSIAEELADVLEVVKAIEKTLNLKKSEVERLRAYKEERRGGFSEGIVLLETSLAAPMTNTFLPRILDEPTPSRTEILPALPTLIRAINIDRRVHGQQAERIVTFTFPIVQEKYRFSRDTFDLPTLTGDSHPMRFEAEVSRNLVDLKIRLKLSNVSIQLGLFDQENEFPANDGDTARTEE